MGTPTNSWMTPGSRFASWGAVALAGAGLALSFPKVDLHLLAWVSLAPLLLAVALVPAWQAWWMGLFCGGIYRAATLYWLVPVMVDFGGLAFPIALLAAASLVLYLAAYVGLFAVFASRCDLTNPKTPLLLGCIWVGLEFGQATLLTGFPWTFLGYAAGRDLLFMQVADVAGVYGLSFVAVVVSVALAATAQGGRRALPALVAAGGLLTAGAIYGGFRLGSAPPLGSLILEGDGAARGRSIPVALVQGNVGQRQKWDAATRATILAQHLELTDRAAAKGATLVVWPETSWPDPYGLEHNRAARALSRLARMRSAALLVGTTHLEGVGDGVSVSNAAVLIDADGERRGRYDKVRLVPFGEYVPLRQLLSFLGPIVEAVASLRAGDEDQALLRAPRAAIPPFGVAICYEIVFPDLVRRQVERGATFLVTITNDAWYGSSSAPYQHFAMARLRAVENRRYLARAANTGISGVIDPWGRSVEVSDLNRVALLAGVVQPRSDRSPYVRGGYWFARLCGLLTLLTAGWVLSPWSEDLIV